MSFLISRAEILEIDLNVPVIVLLFCNSSSSSCCYNCGGGVLTLVHLTVSSNLILLKWATNRLSIYLVR